MKKEDYLAILKKSAIIFISLIIFLSLIELIRFYKSNFKYEMSIHARFTELGPIYSSMPVYYKGFKIGKTKEVEPTDDYKYTLVRIILYPKKLSLPDNVTAKVKKLGNGKNYIELTYPETPSIGNLKNNSIIEGHTAVDIESFMSAQAESGAFASITGNMDSTLTSLQKTSDEVNLFFQDLRVILKENRRNINKSTENTAEILKNLNEISTKLNNSLDQQKLKNLTSNIHDSSDHIKESTLNVLSLTKNLDTATKDLDKTIAKIDETILEANSSVRNINGITKGICELLNKRFAGLRLFFGKPVARSKCPRTCIKAEKTATVTEPDKSLQKNENKP